MAGAGKWLGMERGKAQNLLVAGGLSAFVASIYFYTMKAVGGSDDLQEAVETFEKEKARQQQQQPQTQKASASGSS
ncbi:unnamed protein product [Sphagnum compactum]|jgi:hypothetical protein|nr:hypothetical protein CY35_08G119500 [Sphagnum magellanicum]